MTDTQVQSFRSSRRAFRRVTGISALLVAPAGAWLIISAATDPGLAQALPAAALIWSAALHFLLNEILTGRLQENGLRALLASLLSLLLLPGMPLTSWISGARVLADSGSGPLVLAFCWLAGLGVALIAWALTGGLPKSLAPRSLALANPLQLLLAGLVLAGGFWLAIWLMPLSPGAAAVPFSLPQIMLCALFATVIASLTAQGLEAMTEGGEESLPAPAVVILAALVVLAGLSLLMALPPVDQLGPSGTPVAALLITVLVLLVLLRRAVVLFGCGLMLLAATPAFSAALLATGPALQMFYLCLLCAILAAGLRPAPGQADSLHRYGQPPALAMAQFHAMARSWVVRLDLDDRSLHFPNGSGKSMGFEDHVSFSDVFSGAEFSGLIDLMQLLQSETKFPAGPVRLQLGLRGGAAGETGPGRLVAFDAWVLSVRLPEAWIALVSLEREADLSARLNRYEKLLSEAILREERLLSIASHELRTPMAILSMLGEELKTGASWEDVGAGFETTLERIIGILDDLRAGSGTEGGQAASRGFTLRELGEQVREIFAASALGNGITLEHNIGENSDIQIQCDYNRVFVALSKLVHNAIVHSRARQVVLSAFVTRGADGDCNVTWQVADDGIGIAPERSVSVFEPFEGSIADPEGRPGLGLYTARKALRLMGGDLSLAPESRGSRFVLSHPARIVQKTARAERKVVEVSDVTPLYANRSVLLVEDNKLVGEITSARLRKLFPVVDWAESGDAGLALFREKRYDMVVVDQLLPGMIGSELVKEIRLTEKDLPVIGITASTMGSECRDLENAGANYALEKPLSYGQLKGLAEEFFGPLPEAPGQG
ncbi:response regulator [Pseudogemmobacter faecipullorum]|uniref:histidine kinase n=1 Tax=Pseudogemmobacter faecipullorum TaxID=2755041 RepID=A0ABS8CH87_9RHOB|nr:response regulator [Pseudogemmobacter faecipullorum]